MSDKVNVLDHGFIRLVDSMGSDVSVVRAARVSYNAAWRAGENEASDERLIHYLYGHNHLTPFEAVTMTFEVYAPIFVFRQWQRHRTQSYNELSGRYKELTGEFYLPELENVGVQSTANKQGRNVANVPDDILERRGEELVDYREMLEDQFQLYKHLLESGWPRELARGVLGVAFYSHMFTTMNLRNALHFLDLRTDSHAQFEIRQYANAMVELLRPIAPVTIAAWEASKR